jgi:hypothetical protein
MPFDHEPTAPALPARIEAASPWRANRRWNLPLAWFASFAAAWRETMEMYARAAPYRGLPWRFW